MLLVGNQLIPNALGFPGLRRAASLAGALHALEAELIQRARLLEVTDSPDFASHRGQHPDDPLAALVLVADDISLAQAGRLVAILAQGPAWASGPCCPTPRSPAVPSWYSMPADASRRPLPGNSATSR